MLVVMALGGPFSLADAARVIPAIAGEHAVVVTHSNGPYARDVAKRTKSYQAASPHTPGDTLETESVGIAGRLLKRVLEREMPGRKVASVVTEVEVQLVPVGPHYVDTPDGRGFVAALGWMVVQDGTGFRRCIPTPGPQTIVHLKTIKILIEEGAQVMCLFREGIEVTEAEFGLQTSGVKIDADLAAALLAEQVGADLLMLLGHVDVERVEVDWPKGVVPPLGASTDDALRRISFAPGLMGPKAEAACRFVESTGKRAAIGALAQALEIIRGDSGVQVKAPLGYGRFPHS